jgi:hypothetical protein
MLIRPNNPIPVDNHTSAPTKTTAKTAPNKVPKTQEDKVRDFPRIPRVCASLTRGALPVVMCSPNSPSVNQAKNQCPNSFTTTTESSLPNPTPRTTFREEGTYRDLAAGIFFAINKSERLRSILTIK